MNFQNVLGKYRAISFSERDKGRILSMRSNQGKQMNENTDAVAQDKPFARDYLNRLETALRMTRMIALQYSGCVITVDASWGNGKTYFAHNFAKKLERDFEAHPVYVDAFQNDYADDPFIVLVSAIYAKINEIDPCFAKKTKLLSKAIKIGKSLLPVAAGTTAKVLTFGIVDSKLTDGIGNIAAKFTENILEERIKGYAEQQKNITEFKEVLSNFAQKHRDDTKCKGLIKEGLPLIIFVDELDRCQPTFAVRMLERIKHFFDMENVVFVLFVNKDQIFKAIRGVYGENIDAENYFEKFVNFSVTLGGANYSSTMRESLVYCQNYVSNDLFSKNFDPNIEYLIQEANRMIQTIAVNKENKISLRDVEKIFAYVTHPSNITLPKEIGGLLAFLATLKVKFPYDYIVFLERDGLNMRQIVDRILPDNKKYKPARGSLLSAIKLYCHEDFSPEEARVLGNIVGDHEIPLDFIITYLVSHMDYGNQR